MSRLIGITGAEALAVALSALVVYVVAIAALRLLGPRAATRLRIADLAVLVVIGAILGRAVIGLEPTLAAGLVAVAALVLLRVLTAVVERSPARRLVSGVPILLVGAGRPVPEHLRRAWVDDADLRLALRLAGVATMSEVAAAVLEPNGSISVARRDPARPLDRRLFADVRGIERIPDEWFGPPVRE